MVVYYLNKVSERLADYRYPIKEGDICMLYDGDAVKTIYVDSETETDSIWRDFKFIDSKSLKSYHLPKTDSVLCAPVGDKHAIGDTALLTQLIQECKGEWLLDFLNETSAVLSGFVDYWDLMVLRRLTGDDDIEIAYGDEEALSAFIDEPNENDEDEELEDEYEEEYTDVDILPKSYDIKWFCLSALSCIEDLMDKRSYQILYDTLKGDLRSDIASRFHLTQERIRQIVVKTTKQAKELLEEQRKSLEETKAENAKLKVQLNLLREDMAGLKKLLPQDVLINKSDEWDIDTELTELLETPLKEINLPVRAFNILLYMKVNKFADIPQIENSMKLLKVRNSGRKTLTDVLHFLEDFHLTFGMSLSEIIDVLKKNNWQEAKRKWIEDSEDKVKTRERDADNERKSVGIETQTKPENAITEEATIVLTKEIIEAARTPNGGFTKKQLAAIGIEWPAPLGWEEEKIGMMITPTQLSEFNHIEYVAKPQMQFVQGEGSISYKSVAFNADDRKKMEAVLQAMTHFYTPATPRDIARTISRSAWGNETIREDSVDSILKRLPEVEYIKWGKYILKTRIK